MLKKLKLKFSKTRDTVIILILFLLFFLFLFSLSFFLKRISIISDEILYYDIARSIFYGQGIKELNASRSYQKILYSLIISPFFAIKNPLVRVNLITTFNCVIYASSIFPLWLISKNYLNRKNCYIILILNMIFPYIMFSTSFMAEILYYPLVLWLFYVWIKRPENYNPKKFIFDALLGFVCFIVYACKEVGLVFIIAFCIYDLVHPLINKFINNEKSKYSFNLLLSIGILIGSFILPFIINKYVIFKGQNWYLHQAGLEYLNSITKIIYLLYGTIYSLVAFSMALLIIPVVLPIIHFKNLEKRTQSLLVLLFVTLLIISCVISFTVTIREEWGNFSLKDIWKANARGMLRYYGPLFVLMFIPFLNLNVLKNKTFTSKKNMIILSISCLLICLIYKGTSTGLYMDAFPIMWFARLEKLLKDRLSYIYYLIVIVINLIICLIIISTIYLFERKKTKINSYFVLLGLTSISSICIGSISIRTTKYGSFHYNASKQEINEIINIDNYISKMQIDNNSVLCIFETNILTFDTYINDCRYYIFENKNTFLKQVTNVENPIVVKDLVFEAPYDDLKYDKTERIDFYILEKNIDFGSIKLDNVEKIDKYDGACWSLYKNIDPLLINFTK